MKNLSRLTGLMLVVCLLVAVGVAAARPQMQEDATPEATPEAVAPEEVAPEETAPAVETTPEAEAQTEPGDQTLALDETVSGVLAAGETVVYTLPQDTLDAGDYLTLQTSGSSEITYQVFANDGALIRAVQPVSVVGDGQTALLYRLVGDAPYRAVVGGVGEFELTLAAGDQTRLDQGELAFDTTVTNAVEFVGSAHRYTLALGDDAPDFISLRFNGEFNTTFLRDAADNLVVPTGFRTDPNTSSVTRVYAIGDNGPYTVSYTLRSTQDYALTLLAGDTTAPAPNVGVVVPGNIIDTIGNGDTVSYDIIAEPNSDLIVTFWQQDDPPTPEEITFFSSTEILPVTRLNEFDAEDRIVYAVPLTGEPPFRVEVSFDLPYAISAVGPADYGISLSITPTRDLGLYSLTSEEPTLVGLAFGEQSVSVIGRNEDGFALKVVNDENFLAWMLFTQPVGNIDPEFDTLPVFPQPTFDENGLIVLDIAAMPEAPDAASALEAIPEAAVTEDSAEATPEPAADETAAEVTPETEAEPTPIPGSEIACTVSATNAVNVRATPSTDADILDSIEAGEGSEVVAQTVGDDEFLWWQVGSGGWVRSDVVIESGFCDGVPVAP